MLLVTGRGPASDKPTVTFAPPGDPDLVSRAMTIRVPGCHATHAVHSAQEAVFVTPPVEWTGEIRAFFRDPDGHLREISHGVTRIVSGEDVLIVSVTLSNQRREARL